MKHEEANRVFLKEQGMGVSTVSKRNQAAQKKKRSFLIPSLLQIMAMVGLGVLLYPSAANWFSTLGHDAEIAAYIREIENLQQEDVLDELARAQEYNENIPTGILRDPYSDPQGSDELTSDDSYLDYLNMMEKSDSDVIGNLNYPGAGISLPIYHGTEDSVLTKGVGHLYGSSLPVGGSSTHSVMTSHSGLVNASLFTDLLDAKIGDVFTVSTMGEEKHYQVRELKNVLPHESQHLNVIDGEDWVTLITCTPIGINSHRLLVQAQRIDAPTQEELRAVGGDGLTVGFPWWAALFLGGSIVIAYILFSPPRVGRSREVGKHRKKPGRQLMNIKKEK